MPYRPGHSLQNRYRINQLLGQGGFGVVYLAWDQEDQRQVAIKECFETSATSLRQFKLEANILKHLNHPNLPAVSDYFSIAGESAFLVMDYVEGQDLKSLQDQASHLPPIEEILYWIGQVCGALSYLHAQKPPIIHRDIKPANIRITPQNQAILVDFGIAKLYDPSTKTTLGARAVSQGYSPPEQYGIGSTDVRSDIYSLGATTYHLLTSLMPPPASDLLSGIAGPPPLANLINPSIPGLVAKSLQKAMQLDKHARFKSIVEFKAAILPDQNLLERDSLLSQPSTQVADTLKSPIITTSGNNLVNDNLAERWLAAPSQPSIILQDHSGSVENVVFSQDGKTLASASVDKTVRLWRSTDGFPLQTFKGHSRSVTHVSFSPDGIKLASSSSDGTTCLWNIHDGSIERTFPIESGIISCVEFSPEGESLAIVTGNQGVRIIDVNDGKLIHHINSGYHGISRVAFSPDGRVLAGVGGGEKVICLWRVTDGILQQRLEGHHANISCVTFSSNGSILASGSWDNEIILWRIPELEPVNIIHGHSGGVLSLSFSPDGNILASGAADKSICIWRISSGNLIRKLKGHHNWVTSVAFSPDGTKLVSASRDKSICVWSIQ